MFLFINTEPDFDNLFFADFDSKSVSTSIFSVKSPFPSILNLVTCFLIIFFDLSNFKSIFVDGDNIFLLINDWIIDKFITTGFFYF